MCDLRPYQKQALYWMSKAEKQNDSQQEAETLHTCWSEYRICNEYAFNLTQWYSFIFTCSSMKCEHYFRRIAGGPLPSM